MTLHHLPYPSLQSTREFTDVNEVVPIMDDFALSLRCAHGDLMRTIGVLEATPTKLRARQQRDCCVLVLRARADKIRDVLETRGFWPGQP